MKETYEFAAKFGILIGAAAMILAMAIDMHFIESAMAQNPALLRLGALAGLLCVAVSMIQLLSA